MRYSHTSITVRSIDASIRFYTEVLGLEFVSRRPIPENRAEIAFVRDPATGARIEFTHWDGREAIVAGEQLDHIAFDVDDLEAAVAHARSLGARIGKEPYQLAGSTRRIAFLIDPDEVWIELIQRAAPPG